MKILVFTGGLGNQIFEYAFYLHLKKYFPKQSFYGHYGKKLTEHYGLEIDRWFEVKLPNEKWWTFPVVVLFYFYKQCFPKSKYLDLNSHIWKNKNATIFYPFKFNKDYIPENKDWLKWKIDEKQLSENNKQVLSTIRNEDVCFIHVRRGDYLSPTFKNLFEGCCTIDYYKAAIQKMKNLVPSVKFICFSDDIGWVKQNLELGKDAVFVDWNNGTDSPLDMYLMSQCKYGIIANSTFSYWGARLGIKKEFIICPQKWWNNKHGNPNIYINEWIKI